MDCMVPPSLFRQSGQEQLKAFGQVNQTAADQVSSNLLGFSFKRGTDRG